MHTKNIWCELMNFLYFQHNEKIKTFASETSRTCIILLSACSQGCKVYANMTNTLFLRNVYLCCHHYPYF